MTEKEMLASLLNKTEEIYQLMVVMDAKIDEISERMDFEDQQMAEKIYGVSKTSMDEFEEFRERSH
jgi:hypothetical protein